LASQLDAATGRQRALENHVLHFFNVQSGAADVVHDKRQHADTIVVSYDQLPFGRVRRARFTQFKTTPVLMNVSMTRMASSAIALCAWAVDAPM
jgi:hypothetical protein